MQEIRANVFDKQTNRQKDHMMQEIRANVFDKQTVKQETTEILKQDKPVIFLN